MKLIDILVQELPKRGGWPEGADHIATNGYWRVFAYWVRSSLKGIDLNIVSDAEGYVTRSQYEAALEASKPEWDGEGLPPVGCECQIILGKNGDLGVCEVLFIGSDIVVWRQKSTFAEGSSYLRNVRFLPVRSEADKKREEAVEAMIKHKDDPIDVTENYYHAIYDAIAAGKIPHIRID